jgi:3-oxochol-4-en-24-oyl-CoA dehydrogenase
MNSPLGSPARDAEEIRSLEQSAAEYCERALNISRLRDIPATASSFNRKCWQDMAALGWGAIALPEVKGGFGLGAYGVAGIAQALGKVAAPEPYIETAVVAVSLLASFEEPTVDLETLISGEEIIAVPLNAAAWSRNNLFENHKLQIIKSDNSYVLNGTITQLPLAPDADTFVLPASNNGRLVLTVIPRNTAGVNLTIQTLVDKTRAAAVSFNSVVLDSKAVIDDERQIDAAINRALSLGGVAASAYLLGLSEALLDMTLQHVRTREQFGQPIGAFQSLQHRLVDLFLNIRLTRAAVDRASDAINIQTGPSTGLDTNAIRARYRAVETAMSVAREAIQMHGAMGVTEQCDVSLYVQRILVLSARFGNAIKELPATGLILQTNTPKPERDAIVSKPIDQNFAGDWNTLPDAEFRTIVREWIVENYNEAHRHYPAYLRWTDNRQWHEKLLKRGWAAPAWPVEHGGMGLEPSKMLVYIEELERHGVGRGPDQGIVMLGPILFEHGNADQRARFLQPALTGEHIWCQGYSEPNAGSDLASLKTRAVLEGDEFIVNGQKTWTTHALDATHMYCLVRTDTECKPQRGISFLLIDLNQPGVTVRPITNLSGHVDFCEVFLDDVRVPVENLVGEINHGWTIAKALLGHERLFVGSPKLCQHALNQLHELAHALGLMDDAVFIDELTRITLDINDLEALYTEFAALVKANKPLGADVALLKLGATETYTRLSEMIFNVAGESAALYGKQTFGEVSLDVLSHYYAARPAPIYAGSNEIQRNIIAKHILQLPS